MSFLAKKPKEVAYRYWISRVVPYYLSARILLLPEHDNPVTSHTPVAGAFCAYQAIENALKGALYYYGGRDEAMTSNHDLKKLSRKLKSISQNKLVVSIPRYFSNYQNITRYPESKNGTKGSGLRIEATIVDDLDEIIYKVVSHIPDKGPNLLKNLVEYNSNDVPELSKRNKRFSKLKFYYWGKIP